jgi:nicotinate-nucleotide adenylyltransferase
MILVFLVKSGSATLKTAPVVVAIVTTYSRTEVPVGLALDEVRLIPSGQPWQKSDAITPSRERLAMVEAAIKEFQEQTDTGIARGNATSSPALDAQANGASDYSKSWHLMVDPREVDRDGPTYTIDTLIALRAELGPLVQLVWLMGADQLANLPTWHRWRELLEFAHLGVTSRGPAGLGNLPPPVVALLAEHGRDALPELSGAEPSHAAGTITTFRMPPVPLSSTELRRQLRFGARPTELVPKAVLELIDRNGLYR